MSSSHDCKLAYQDRLSSNSCVKVKSFKYLGSLVTNQNSIQEEIKCRLKAGNSGYFSVQKLLSSRLPSENSKIKKYKTIFPIVLYGHEAWSLTLREEHRLRVFANRILRWIFGPKRDANGEWKSLHNKELHTLYHSPNVVRRLKWAGRVARMQLGRSAP